MNSESAQSSKKRLIENDDLQPPDKKPKQESRIVLRESNYLPVIIFFTNSNRKISLKKFFCFFNSKNLQFLFFTILEI